MPTSWKRIHVTQDLELEDALAEVAPYYPALTPARLVHDLAVRGAQEVVREQASAERAIEALVAFSTERRDLIDWDVLERIDDDAYGA